MNNISLHKDNIFTTKSQTLVNTVNCVGVMGAGIALEFKFRYPRMFDKYVELCKSKLIEIGKLWIYDVPNSNQKILNFPTKKDWKHPSKYEYLDKGLARFVESYREKKITSAAFPLLGAQNGGLNPQEVISLMTFYLSKCDIPIEIYEYTPNANDDLIIYVKKLFSNNSLKVAEKITGIKVSQLSKMQNTIENDNLNSLIQVSKIKGIGKDIIGEIFQFALRCKAQDILLPKEIFSKDSLNEVKEDNLSIHIDFDNSKTNHNSHFISDPIPAKIGLANHQVNIGDEEPSIPLEVTKKNVKKKDPLKKEITLYQKILYTDLSEDVILKIENKEEDVTIHQLKMYCKGMKLSFKAFITKTYSAI